MDDIVNWKKNLWNKPAKFPIRSYSVNTFRRLLVHRSLTDYLSIIIMVKQDYSRDNMDGDYDLIPPNWYPGVVGKCVYPPFFSCFPQYNCLYGASSDFRENTRFYLCAVCDFASVVDVSSDGCHVYGGCLPCVPSIEWSFCFAYVDFYPRPVFGLRVLSLPVSVCVCINHLFVRTITRHLFKLGSPNLVQRSKTHWLRSLLFLGAIDLDLQGQI